MPSTSEQTGEQVYEHDEIYLAESRIRQDHRGDDPLWKFWTEVADWMNRMASKGHFRLIGNARDPERTTWSEFNGCVAAARSYNEVWERVHLAEAKTPDPTPALPF